MNKVYRVELTNAARKNLRMIDPVQRTTILRWMHKHLHNCENPRAFGKALSANRSDEWCYRVGSYRILADIQDDCILVEVFKIGHRGKVYR